MLISTEKSKSPVNVISYDEMKKKKYLKNKRKVTKMTNIDLCATHN